MTEHDQVVAEAQEATETKGQMRARADAAKAEIDQVLAKHGCMIVPLITGMEKIGYGSRAIIETAYGVVPVPQTEEGQG